MAYKKKLVFISIITIVVIVYMSYTEKLPAVFNDVNEVSIGTLEYRNLSFNKDKDDVFSFLHIQKTGGTTMEKHLIYNIKNSNCECRKTKKPSCMCYRKDDSEIWLVCRYIEPKWPCGLHPDYDTLKECTPHFMDNTYTKRKRRYFYGTILREPTHRFISEFRHIQRGANWEAAASLCQGSQLTSVIPRCFDGKIWLDLTLEKFLSCPYNLATNRQTWMLSSISSISCDFRQLMENENYQSKLLSIAKKNLENLVYFGLLEYPTESQFVFEKTFGMEFDEPFQLWNTGFVKAYLENDTVTDDMQRIREANALDIQLYAHATTIFFQRYNYFKNKYGRPKFRDPPKKGKFAMKNSKKRRLMDNLPKSPVKEKNLRKKIEEERRRQRLKKSEKFEVPEDDYVEHVLDDDDDDDKNEIDIKKIHHDDDEQDEESFISKKFRNKINSIRKIH